MKKDSVLDRWRNRKKESTDAKDQVSKKISRKPAEVKTPLSFGQQRLLFLQQLLPDNPFYNYAEVYEWREI